MWSKGRPPASKGQTLEELQGLRAENGERIRPMVTYRITVRRKLAQRQTEEEGKESSVRFWGEIR